MELACRPGQVADDDRPREYEREGMYADIRIDEVGIQFVVMVIVTTVPDVS